MKITADKTLFFDLDGTLIDTDYANWLAYTEAMKKVLDNEDLKKVLDNEDFKSLDCEFDFVYSGNSRITSKYLEEVFYSFGLKADINKVSSKKQEIYSKILNFNLTKKIEENVSILKRFYKTNKIVLVSNASKKRGLETLRFHKLDSYFHQMFFKEDKTLSHNKYENAIKKININPKSVIAFEDDEKEIQKAREVGIKHINIKIEGENIKDRLKEFTIDPNYFLKENIQAFYHKDYLSGSNWNTEGKIEHLIWSLKNDEGCQYSHKIYLSTACKRLKNILINELPEIKNRIKIDGQLTICVVPRAKEESVYQSDQLLFRETISNTIGKLDGFENGTKYIVRHTTTYTTHLKNTSDEGSRPYKGITKNTCNISDNVIGKNILLIDDVYTRTANIDEDAIQALLDKGAKKVWFYSIGKTIMNKNTIFEIN